MRQMTSVSDDGSLRTIAENDQLGGTGLNNERHET